MSQGLNTPDLQVGQDVVLSDGVIVQLVRKLDQTNKQKQVIFLCRDSDRNESEISGSEIVNAKAKWPYDTEKLSVFKPTVGERRLSILDGYYSVVKLEGTQVLIQWEITRRLSYVNVARVGNGNVKEVIDGYYIYSAKHNDETVYIGKGKSSRFMHCVTGTSHVYELNSLHFLGEKVEVSILRDGLTETDAIRLERELIEEVRPAFNKVYLTHCIPATSLRHSPNL